MTVSPLSDRKALALAIATVAIEGYDLSLYAVFSVALATAFFPSHEPGAALLLAVGTLGVGYFMRPIGGILLGAYADKRGRTAAMSLTVLLMAGSTGVIGLIPSYMSIGIVAPCLVVLARLVQGVSAGGATASSLSYLLESAPPEKRGYYSSYQQAAQVAALLFASATGAIVAELLSPAALANWGWRIPFLLALVFGPVGLLIRKRLPETEAFTEAKKTEREPLSSVLKQQWPKLIAGIGICCLLNSTTFVMLFYLPTYAQTQIGLSAGAAFLSSCIATLLLAPLCLVGGMLSDRVGRKPVMIVAAIALLLFIYPVFAFAYHSGTFTGLLIAQCLMSVMIAAYTGPANVALGELFATADRATGISISFNLSILSFGAFGPFWVTWLMQATGNPLAISYYICGAAVVSIVTLCCIRESREVRLSVPVPA